MKKGNPINISFILFFPMLAVSTSPVAAKLLNQDSQVDGIIIAFWRMAFAAIILWAFSLFKTQKGFKTIHFGAPVVPLEYNIYKGVLKLNFSYSSKIWPLIIISNQFLYSKFTL